MSNPVPFETTRVVRDTCLCLHMQRAARALARRFDEVLRPVGLTNQQFSLLMALNRPEPPAMGPVATLLAMDRTTLTAALKPLERRGLVKIAPSAADRRSRLLALTKAGERVLAAAVPIWQETHATIESQLHGLAPDALRAGLGAVSSTALSREADIARDRIHRR
jgi:DNA-binding MarR family transcriptional regulator